VRLPRLPRSARPSGRTVLIFACTALLAVGITSIATGAAGDFVRIGKRNAAPGTTAIVGSTTGFSTRQSNNTDGDGGAASYGCRADTGKEACLFVLNHHNGEIFKFSGTGGTKGGEILISPPSGKKASDVAPFTTNATGVATGLNADQVDGQSATDIIASAVAKAQPLFAGVEANGTASSSRGLAQSNAVQHTADSGTYTVKFASDVSKCAWSATEVTTSDAGAAAVQLVSGTTDTIQVVTRAGGGADGTGPTAPADRAFHLIVNC
jgi:hypothetical protein